jgi:hypothetical protein
MASKRSPSRKRVPWDASGLPEGLLPATADRPDNWHDRAGHLVGVYNACLERAAEAGHFTLRVRRPNKNTREVFCALDIWCLARKLDTTAWIYAAFASLGWKRPVSMRDLFNEKRRTTYDGLYDGEWRAVAGVQTTVTSLELPTFKPFRDLHPSGAEVVKAQYAARGDYELCLINMDFTLGYHPASPTCQECPLRTRCRLKMEALRQEVESR